MFKGIQNIPKNWTVSLIPEVLYFQEGPGVRKWQFTTSGVKLLNGGNINNNELHLDSTKIYISKEEASGKYRHFLIESGDLVIACSGILVEKFKSKIAFVEEKHLPLCLNTSTMRFKSLGSVDLKFFSYFLQTEHFSDQLAKLITGSAQLNFGPSQIKKIHVPLPKLEEQKTIAAILDAADDCKHKTKALIEKYDQLTQSLFLDMFGDPVTNPKGWSQAPIGDVIDVRDGTHDSPKYTHEGYPLITSKNIVDGKLSFQEVNLISKTDFDSINRRSKVEFGDIIMPMIGTIGNPVQVLTEEPFAIKNVALFKKSTDQILLMPILFMILKGHYLLYYSSENNRGGTQKFLSLGAIRRMPIYLPHLNLQIQFAERVAQIEKQKQQVEASLVKAEELFKSLLNRAFEKGLSGKVPHA